MDDLRPHVRLEPPPGTLLVRGGEDTVQKLRRHAERTLRAFTLDGRAVYGLSVFCALDELAQRQLYRRLAAYPVLRTSLVGRLRRAGFQLLPTFSRPHFTVIPPSVEADDLARLLAGFDPPSTIPGMDADASGGARKNMMVTVDITTADLHDEDETGYVWTFLDEARQPSLIRPGSAAVAHPARHDRPRR